MTKYEKRLAKCLNGSYDAKLIHLLARLNVIDDSQFNHYHRNAHSLMLVLQEKIIKEDSRNKAKEIEASTRSLNESTRNIKPTKIRS